MTKLHYTEYYGDGNSKGFASCERYLPSNPCHQKRMYWSHLEMSGKSFTNIKKEVSGLGCTGKLTDSMVDRLQNYYAIAIRSNVSDLPKM